MNRIDILRSKKSMSYGDLAKASGITASYIHLLAKGKRNNPSFEVMQKLSQALGEKVEKVFQMN